VVSALTSLNEVNLYVGPAVSTQTGDREPWFSSQCRTLISVGHVTNHPTKANSAFHPSGQVWFIQSADVRGCAGKTEIS